MYGDVPPLVEVEITPSGGAAAPIWALIGWWERPSVWNRVWNGDFESPSLAANGWSVASVANLNSGAATSVARITSAGKYGVASGQIVAPASADRGAAFRIFRPFRKGVTYTAEAWIHSAAGVTNTYIRLGNAAANDKASSGNTALSPTWQRITIAWTPTADYNDAYVAVNIAAATATTFEIDGVMVYEGTVAPTSAGQSEGRGGFPPLGVLEAENDSSAGTLAASANYRSGSGVTIGGNDSLDLVVDAGLLVADDYSAQSIAIEVWARCEITTTSGPAFVLSAVPITSSSGPPVIYTDEYGSAGKTIVRPSAGTVRRLIRLGTFRLNTDTRYVLRLTDAGTDTVDYLLLLPATARALSPTGKVNDGAFPAFVSSTNEITRRIRADLSGAYSEPGVPEVPSAGLGGSLLEFPPRADIDVVVKLSSLVPDDPSSNTNTEQLSHSATVHFKVTPRYRVARPA